MRLLAALATLLVRRSALAGAASAHAALISDEPATAACWRSAPKTVELRFNEAVTRGAVS